MYKFCRIRKNIYICKVKGNSRKGWQPLTTQFLSHSLQQIRWFRAPKFNSHSSEWLCCYRAVIQYWTLSPVDFCSPTVILTLSSCMIYIFRNGFWILLPFFGSTSATFCDSVKSSDNLITTQPSQVKHAKPESGTGTQNLITDRHARLRSNLHAKPQSRAGTQT